MGKWCTGSIHGFSSRTNESGWFWGVWVVGTGYKPWIRWDIGVNGGDGGDSNGVGCWLNGWVVYRGGLQIKM